MDFKQAFTFVFKDEDWIKKVLLGILISFVPIFGQFALVGYMLAIIRNVKNGEPRPLPDWSEVVQYFVGGLKLWVVNMVYSLPALVLSCPLMFIGFLPLLAGDNPKMMETLGGITGILALVLSLPAVLYGLFLTLLSPVLLIRLAETEEISACLRFKEIVRFAFANIGPIIIALLLVFAAGAIVVPIAAGLTLGLLGLLAPVWINASLGHLCGQIARKAEQITAV
jgi:hypothetical protein